MNTPLISVVIPLYNKEAYIARTVESALNQTFPDREIIVVNDGSTDGSAEAVAPYRDRIVYIEQANAGPSVARNRGIEEARGKYVAFLDGDDLWHPRKLEYQAALFEAEPDLAWCATDFRPHVGHEPPADWPGEQPAPDSGLWEVHEDWFAATNRGMITQTSCLAVLREKLNDIGGFDKAIPAGQDRDLFVRLGCENPRFGQILRPLVLYFEGVPGCISLSGRKKFASKLVCEKKNLALLARGDVSDSCRAFLQRQFRNYLRQTLVLGMPDLYKQAVREARRKACGVGLGCGHRLAALCPDMLLYAAARIRNTLMKRNLRNSE